MSNVPVLVGIAHIEQRAQAPESAREPLELMIEAVTAAARDAGSERLLREANSVRVTRGLWPYLNPAKVITEAIGCSPSAETALTPFGGNFVQTTVNQSALDIQRGKQDIILLAGAECGQTQARAKKRGIELNWQAAGGTPDRVIGKEMEMRHAAEKKMHIGRPIQIYPMFETAWRHHLGHSVDAHQQHIAELWASFSEVAATNPNAWIRNAKTADEIRTPSADNRPVSFPYPKLMNSNNNVDQAAALIMCSTDKAKALGIPESQWIYPWIGTDAHDHDFVSNRDNLYSSPAIRIAGRRALQLAGVEPGELDRVDVYSCFPVAVQVAAAEIGLDTHKPLTVTGGLTFAGGPLNNYVMHSIVRMAELLRKDRGTKGLITANGGYLTKHSFGVYSGEAPPTPFQHQDVQREVDTTPRRDVHESFAGSASIEGYTVMYGLEGPKIAHLACIADDGLRVWANCEDPDTIQAMTTDEFCGRRVRIADALASA